ncbi:S-adenosyl-L-methionine-dependent 2-deoxy-scyllo-inosamine dehydrogenase [Clostridium homopropionicum DSM 5847]|uniref:S-adenosyl-L-methionine-dependent 2-deoxy-scyllo-inosamine dehydrogenase n=1 Tax=Clostridium homopropionicum DSM 5847 TaxID=1121318 RepID=A0A0L6ZDI7_9CLOT|nr:radical SAM protein [Clostridium homopropionicum]KOA21030.1 S-adenosyl-L-methionine-dependent 2-deoxy-scyllo-inosamine dehydrogenase [Clostridium homopropionicum DSM 5847]SFF99007.1 radical SAM additional 4Fe4S-binding SPASM domain-containing protein [Clostridium homopropionicum]
MSAYSINKFPNRITIELNNTCNLECSFCPRNLVDMELGFMEEKLFYKIIDEAANNLPVAIVLFFRGESLLHPKLVKFISYAKKKGIGPIQLASNGLLLDKKLSEELIESGIDFISFSLDTIKEEIYSKTRKNGNLNKSIENIVYFCEKCKNAKKNSRDIPEIQISTVDIEEYKKDQEAFIEFWLKHVDKVRVYVEHSNNGNLGSISEEILKYDKRMPCRKVYQDMVVYWNGDIALCNHDWNNKLDLGNVKENSIENIWDSIQYKKVRKMHEENDYTGEIVCKNCDHWKMYYIDEGMIGKIYSRVE